MIVYCATSNPGKLREFQLAGEGFDVRPLPASLPAPEEHGATFEENAAAKAVYYSRFADGYLFADDSGLEVDALGGAPGVRSARYAGPNATDQANNALLLQRLQGVKNRTARFVCVIALARRTGAPHPGARVSAEAGELITTFRGVVEGQIAEGPRGSNGFGYDPLFYHEPFGCTFGQANLGSKMLVSHRAQALAKLFAYLRGVSAA